MMTMVVLMQDRNPPGQLHIALPRQDVWEEVPLTPTFSHKSEMDGWVDSNSRAETHMLTLATAATGILTHARGATNLELVNQRKKQKQKAKGKKQKKKKKSLLEGHGIAGHGIAGRRGRATME